MFEFLDIRRIEGDEIDLLLDEKIPAKPEKAYVPCYSFYMVLHGTETKVGGCNLRVGFNRNIFFGGNIGYCVNEEHRGNRYAAKACLLLKGLAKQHGMDHLIITNSPDNIASRRTCEIIGASLVEIVDLPEDNEMYKEGARRKCRYRLEL